MSIIAERTILFADLRGSTGLFERLGNTQATHVVTSSIGSLCAMVEHCGGTVIKTLGDGLMASFLEAGAAVRAARSMHQSLHKPEVRAGDHAAGLTEARPTLKVQVAVACGEIVEMDNDCFGDAVNIAARLLDHAGDNEILVTAEVVSRLTKLGQQRFRSLDQIQLRGRSEPVHVLLTTPRRDEHFAATRLETGGPATGPAGIRLSWLAQDRTFTPQEARLTLGRSPQATYCIDDSRVSRLHARIDWHGSTFQLSDLSYNGSYVRFDHDPELVALRRGRCTLHGSGSIGLGSPPSEQPATSIRFEVVRRCGAQITASPGRSPSRIALA